MDVCSGKVYQRSKCFFNPARYDRTACRSCPAEVMKIKRRLCLLITDVLSRAPVLSPLEAVIVLIIPIVFCHILIFYIVFELILNGLAEVTRFADRRFYDDWWNRFVRDLFLFSFFLSLTHIFGLAALLGMNMPANGTNQFMNGF